ncbi:hypothetical protein ERJ75_000902300 [Trypanosoma vivax]|nr:hypothetical protein ERJ75_000902300 [Trypanosoma vivax]
MQHRSRARQWTDKHRCQRQGVERAESNERYQHGLQPRPDRRQLAHQQAHLRKPHQTSAVAGDCGRPGRPARSCCPRNRARHEAKRHGRGRAGTCDPQLRWRAQPAGTPRPSTANHGMREGPQDAGLGVRKGAVAAGGKRRRTRSKRACPGSRTLASGAGATCSRWTNGHRGQAATRAARRLARRGPVSPDCAFRRRPDRIAHEEKVAARGQAPYERCAATLHAAKGRRNRSSAGSGHFCRTAWVSVTRRTRAEGQWRVARDLRHPWPR